MLKFGGSITKSGKVIYRSMKEDVKRKEYKVQIENRKCTINKQMCRNGNMLKFGGSITKSGKVIYGSMKEDVKRKEYKVQIENRKCTIN